MTCERILVDQKILWTNWKYLTLYYFIYLVSPYFFRPDFIPMGESSWLKEGLISHLTLMEKMSQVNYACIQCTFLRNWCTADCHPELTTVGWGTKDQCFCPPYLKTWFFYVVFNAELNGTTRNLCFRRAIIDLLWHSRAQLGHSRSIMARRKRKILMVLLYSALRTST